MEGSQTQYCSVCGEALNVQTIPALVIDWEVPSTPSCSHTEVKWEKITQADCENDGSRTGTCSSCGQTVTETIPATGHTEETIEAVEATCTVAGSTEGSKCSVCGEILVEPKEIPALGHSFTVVYSHMISSSGLDPIEGTEVGATVMIGCERMCDNSIEDTHTVTYDGQIWTCKECGGIKVKVELIEL